jgi:hypothetical protein
MFFIETLTSQSTNREFDNVGDAIVYIRWALESNFKPNEIIINNKSFERIIAETATWGDAQS